MILAQRSASLWWSLGVIAALAAIPFTVAVASILPFGYDLRAYWLAAEHLVSGGAVYPALDAPLGQPDEFHYLPIVALPFIALLPFSIMDAARVWLALELILAAVVGVELIRPLPRPARPWAAAAYIAFLPLVLEITLGNVDLVCLALALLAWHWRERPLAPVLPLAAAVGIKFLPVVLLPFYLAARYVRLVALAFAVGVAALLATLPFVLAPMADFVALLPRYIDTAWVRLHADREDPAWLATVVWSDLFPLTLAVGAVGLAIVWGRNAAREPAHATDWHHLTLAIAPYATPFGFVWTTFLITSLPLFSITFARALRQSGTTRVTAIVGLALSWFAMQIVRTHDLWPLVAHSVGVVGLCAIALALMSLESRQTLGRSTPRSRATRIASG